MRLLILQCLVSPLLLCGMSSTLEAQTPSDSLAPGCYRIGSIDSILPYPLPPREFTLSLKLGTEGLERNRRLARPLVDRYRYASWHPGPGDSITIFWTTGFQVSRLRLQHSPRDTLRGILQQSDDVRIEGEVEPQASVVVLRVPCRG